MPQYNWKFPDSALFNTEKAKSLIASKTNSYLQKAVSTIKFSVKEAAPVGANAQLKNTISSDVTGNTGKVRTGVDYAVVVEEGRGAGKKMPPKGSLLTWLRTTSQGQAIFAQLKASYPKITLAGADFVIRRSISKKGIDPNNFFERGVDAVQPILQRLTNEFSNQVAEGLVQG